MKKVLNFSILAMVCLLFSSCGGGGITDPVEYNNQMITVVNDLNTEMAAMNQAMVTGDFAKADEVRTAWLTTIDKSVETANSIGNFKGDSSLKDVILAALSSYKEVVDKDYKKLIDIRKAGVESEEAQTEDAEVLNKINTTLAGAQDSINDAFEKFVEGF